MAAYYLIQNNLVVNVIEWDGVTKYVPGNGYTLAQVAKGIPNGVTIPPPPPPDSTADPTATLMANVLAIKAKVGA